MSYTVHFDQHLQLGDVPLSTPAWEVLNLHVLMSGPTVRGENRRMPGATGVRALRHRADETSHTLELLVNGHVDPYGTPHPDPQQGVWDNWTDLRDRFGDLLTTDGNSTITATATFRGHTLSGPVQVLGFEVGVNYSPDTIGVALDITIPGGWLR